MTRSKSFLYNVVATLGMYVLTVLAGFLVPKVMMIYYGSEINGLVSSLTQFIAYFNLVEAGLSGAAIFSLYKPLADKNWDKVSSIVVAAKKFYFQAGYLYVGLTIILSLIYPVFIHPAMLSAVEVGILTLVLGFSGAVEFFTLAKYRALLTADQKTYIISNAQAVYIILNTLIIVVLSMNTWDIVLVRTIALLAVILRSLILYLYCKVHYKHIDFQATPDMPSLDKRWDALFLQIITSIQGSGLLIIATLVTDLNSISICTVYGMIIAGIVNAIRVLQSGLTAAFGELLAKKELLILQKAYGEFESIFYGVVVVGLSTCYVMITPFIKIYTIEIHDVNYILPMLASLFVINEFFDLLKAPGGMIIISAGMYRETRWRNTIQTVILVFFGILLGHYFEIMGIVMGIMLSNIYRDLDILFFVPKHILKNSYIKTLYKWIKTVICFFISCLPFYWIDMTCTGYVSWGIKSIGVMVYSMVVFSLITFVFDRAEFYSIYKRFKNMLIH